MRKLIFFGFPLLALVQSSLGQNNLKHSIFAEAWGGTDPYGVGYEIGWLNKENVSLQSSLSYGMGYFLRHNLNFRTDISFLKFDHFQINSGHGFSYNWQSGWGKAVYFHLGCDVLFFDKCLSLNPYYMYSLDSYLETSGGSPWVSRQLRPFWGGFRLKYTFPNKEKT